MSDDTPVAVISVDVEEAQPGGALEALVERAVKRAMENFNSTFQKEIEKLQVAIKTVENLVADLTPVLKAMLDARVSPIEKELDALKIQVSDNFETINTLSSSIPKMDCNALHDELNEIRLQANKGITLANENEQYSRRNNLRIKGLAPAEDNDNLGAVLKFLSGNLGVTNVNPIDIVAVHPLPPMKAKGHQPDGTARPAVPVMLLKLRNRQIRDNIIMKRKSSERISVLYR